MRNDKLIWIPRGLLILYIIFLSIFAFDEPFGTGFLIHLIPSFILIAILACSWKSFKLAGILTAVAGLGTVIFFKTYTDWIVFLIVSVPAIITGILFWIFSPENKKKRKKKK